MSVGLVDRHATEWVAAERFELGAAGAETWRERGVGSELGERPPGVFGPNAGVDMKGDSVGRPDRAHRIYKPLNGQQVCGVQRAPFIAFAASKLRRVEVWDVGAAVVFGEQRDHRDVWVFLGLQPVALAW